MQSTTANSETLILLVLPILIKIFRLKYKTKKPLRLEKVLRGFFPRDFFKELSNNFSNEKFLVYFYSRKQLLLTLSAQ